MGHKGFKVTPDSSRFQFLGIPPKGELSIDASKTTSAIWSFQFLGIPPKGERSRLSPSRPGKKKRFQFLGIPPKGELALQIYAAGRWHGFPISRDPPEGGTVAIHMPMTLSRGFQFLGIPPKGEHRAHKAETKAAKARGFQFLGIPPKGEQSQKGRHCDG